ncbi:hypothetical protein SLEP1_g1681 [Rubroshorea leprosula]|uniref:Uncharacterized protein n=1 Tax=Rubroshorea leprosula TaxID=152421 RepID=A0AAV5HMU4_9ROSI|nr:hypothetical protein SLEP1_g1681 [Rubroshorea leprosula]
MCLQGFGYKEPLVGFVLLNCLSFACHSLHGFSIPCNNVSLGGSCPASLYNVPNTCKSLEETAALFSVNSNAVNRTIDGFSIAINCSCLPGHDEFILHVDYEVQPGDKWESVSSKFGSFVVEKTERTLIAFQVVTLDLLCGCSKNGDVVIYRV